MDIAFLLFDGITALDAVGPYEVLSRLPAARVRFVGVAPGVVETKERSLGLRVSSSLADVRTADVLVVPGGPGTRALLEDASVLGWLRDVHETTTWTTSVCTGSLLLGAAGLLRGVRATTHWLAVEQLAGFGAVPVRERFVIDGKIATAAGVSAGIDLALTLAARIAGPDVAQEIQLMLEYAPRPPFDAGSPERAPAEIVDRLRRRRERN
jgi:transcriptional regulator GlxA family with amidase domain